MAARKRIWLCTDKTICDRYDDIMLEAMEQGLWKETYVPQLYLCKSVSSHGFCQRNPYTKQYEIILNELHVNNLDYATETLVHEVGHACAPYHHHDSYWKYITSRIARKFGCEVSRCCQNAEKNAMLTAEKKVSTNYKYELYCPCCGVSWKYKTNCSAVQHPERYMHKRCGTTLKSREI